MLQAFGVCVLDILNGKKIKKVSRCKKLKVPTNSEQTREICDGHVRDISLTDP